jgi:hypothetical protein
MLNLLAAALVATQMVLVAALAGMQRNTFHQSFPQQIMLMLLGLVALPTETLAQTAHLQHLGQQ